MRLAVWPVAPARALARALAAAAGPDPGTPGQAPRPLVTSVVEAEPHAMRAALDAGDVDLALVPTLDVLRAPDGLGLVPGAALVGDAGPRRALVATAALWAGSGPEALATVGFDPRDTQEALVAQLVLRENYGLAPAFALADLSRDLPALLAEHDAVLAAADAPVPDGAYRLDLGREWTDLTLRPMTWGLVAARADALAPDVAEALAEAAAAVPDDEAFADALRNDEGAASYQLTLDGYALDGLAELAEYLFAHGTLTEIPELPFVVAPEPAADDDAPAGDGAAGARAV